MQLIANTLLSPFYTCCDARRASSASNQNNEEDRLTVCKRRAQIVGKVAFVAAAILAIPAAYYVTPVLWSAAGTGLGAVGVGISFAWNWVVCPISSAAYSVISTSLYVTLCALPAVFCWDVYQTANNIKNLEGESQPLFHSAGIDAQGGYSDRRRISQMTKNTWVLGGLVGLVYDIAHPDDVSLSSKGSSILNKKSCSDHSSHNKNTTASNNNSSNTNCRTYSNYNNSILSDDKY